MAYGQLIDQRKLNKRNHVVGLFRSEAVLSKARVRQVSGYSMDTIIGIFKSLEEEGFVVPVQALGQEGLDDDLGLRRGRERTSPRSKGRPAELYELRTEREIYLGITFNQAGIFSALVSFSGAVLSVRKDELPELSDQGAFETAFVRHLLAFLAENGERIPCIRHIGLALPGQHDAERGILLHYGLMPYLRNLDLGLLLRRHLAGIPLDCRHNVAGLASHLLRDAGLDRQRILYVSARAGAAHALIQDGRVLLDNGEMGHLRAKGSEGRCECGRVGCLDTLFSASEFRRLLPDLSWEAMAARLHREEEEGRHETKNLIEAPFKAFCEALLDLCASFSPDLVVLSGELLSILPEPIAWLTRWMEDMLDFSRPPAWLPKEFRLRMTGAEAAAIGLCYSLIEADWAWQED